MLGNFQKIKAFIVENEGGRNCPPNYCKYYDTEGVATIGYGFSSYVFPNRLYQTMPDMMTPEQCDELFEVLLTDRFQSFATEFPAIRDGTLILGENAITVMTDIEWQYGSWCGKNYCLTKENPQTADELFNLWSNMYRIREWADRYNKRVALWHTPDENRPPAPAPKPPTNVTNKPETPKKPEGAGQPQDDRLKKKLESVTKNLELIKNKLLSYNKGTYYLKNNGVYQVYGENGMPFIRHNDYLFMNMDIPDQATRPPTSSEKPSEPAPPPQPSEPAPPPQPPQPPDLPIPQAPDTTKVEEVINEMAKIPLLSLNYVQGRPQKDPVAVGWADCSGFVGWCFRNVLPEVYNNGWTNTSTQNAFFRQRGAVIFEGGNFDELMNVKPQRGDVLLMGSDCSTGPGDYSHVGVFIDGEHVQHMPYSVGPKIDKASIWRGYFNCFVLCRWN